MINLPENWDTKLKNIYDSVPGFNCEPGCGKCCVNPHITFLEFLYFVKESEKHLGFFDRRNLMVKQLGFHEYYEGNLKCRYQKDDHSCGVHNYRPLPCRLFGIPALSELNIIDLENCEVLEEKDLPKVNKPVLQSWIADLVQLNNQIYSIMEGPFYLTGLSMDCWMAFYFEELPLMEPFDTLKALLRKQTNLELMRPYYNNTTRFKEKIWDIVDFYSFHKEGQLQKAAQLLNHIIKAYPRTGTWFVEEAQAFKKEMSQEAA
jgi:Fe-S-cluster containining protein